MQKKTYCLSIRTDIHNKADNTRTKLGKGWKNVKLNIDEIVSHIRAGHPVAHKFSDGVKDLPHFLQADFAFIDIDQGMSLEEAKSNEFVQRFAGFIYTTAQHTPKNNRFRIVFPLNRSIFDPNRYKSLLEGLKTHFPLDESTKDAAQCFFGFDKTKIFHIGRSLPAEQIDHLVKVGNKKSVLEHKVEPRAEITESTLVKTTSGHVVTLGSLKSGTSIHCAFGTHTDKNPSAFVTQSNDGVIGIHCHSCHITKFTKHKTPIDVLPSFDELVIQHNGKANSHFQYQGLSLYDPELESSLEKSNFHLTNTKNARIPSGIDGIHLIKSAKGTGKTHALAELMDQLRNPIVRNKLGLGNSRSILIGHRQSLIRESANKLGMECYLDTHDIDWKVVPDGNGGRVSLKPQHYAICLDSLSTRIKPHHEEYGVVIIDESEQVFSHFLSTQMKRPEQNFSMLARLIQNAKYVYCLDADLDRITITGVLSCLRKPRIGTHTIANFPRLYFHLNKRLPPAKDIALYESKPHLEDDLRKALLHGKRCFVTSNSKKLATDLYKAFQKGYPDKHFICVTSDTCKDPEIQDFLHNIKTDILEYDAVFCSPSIGTGIDLTFPNNEVRIDYVFGFFEPDVNTHFDIDQQLARVRHPGSIRLWISPKPSRLTTDHLLIKEELLDKNLVSGLGIFINEWGAELAESQYPYMDLIAEIHSVQRKSKNRLLKNFVEYKEKQGWTIRHVQPIIPSIEHGKVIARSGKQIRQKDRTQNLLNAKALTFKQKQRLKDRKSSGASISHDERHSLERDSIEHFYRSSITEDLINFDDEGKTRTKIWRYELTTDRLLSNVNFAEVRWLQADLMKYSKAMCESDIQVAMFLRGAFEAAGIFDKATCSFIADHSYSNDELGAFISYMIKHKVKYERLFERSINQNIRERAVSQLTSMLKLVGLTQSQVKRNRGKESGPASYKIDLNQLQMIENIVKTRKSSKNRVE